MFSVGAFTMSQSGYVWKDRNARSTFDTLCNRVNAIWKDAAKQAIGRAEFEIALIRLQARTEATPLTIQAQKLRQRFARMVGVAPIR